MSNLGTLQLSNPIQFKCIQTTRSHKSKLAYTDITKTTFECNLMYN